RSLPLFQRQNRADSRGIAVQHAMAFYYADSAGRRGHASAAADSSVDVKHTGAAHHPVLCQSLLQRLAVCLHRMYGDVGERQRMSGVVVSTSFTPWCRVDDLELGIPQEFLRACRDELERCVDP